MLIEHAQQLEQRRLGLLQKFHLLKQNYQEVQKETAQAQARVHMQPQIKTVLEELQRREHARTVGAYEDMLTALILDVLPEPIERVILDLKTEKGLPGLHVLIQKNKTNPAEDIFNGNGGAVTNLISFGLRVIALLRSGERKFLVLDEADCWIQPELAPAFAQVVYQLSIELGVQILMISHHSEHHFPMLPHRLHLFQQNGMVQAAWSANGSAPVWDPEQEGIRSITLEHFQSHTLTHLPLSPHVTLLSGHNNLGKSSILQALRCVFLNEGEDSFIQHHQPSTKITVDFGPEHCLIWERFRKGKVVEHYKLIDAKDPTNPLHSSPVATLPDWVFEHSHIGLIQGFDVQLRHQKKPVFLLDESASTRAKVLAVGSDATYVQTMITLDKQDLQEARATIKWGEKHLEHVNRQIQSFEPIYATQSNFEQLKHQVEHYHAHTHTHQQHTVLYARWSSLAMATETLSWIQDHDFPSWPDFKPLQWISPHLTRWKDAHFQIKHLSHLLSAPFPQISPTLLATNLHWEWLGHWQHQVDQQDLLNKHLASSWFDYPSLQMKSEYFSWLHRWKQHQQRALILEPLQQQSFMDYTPPPTRVNLPWRALDTHISTLQTELRAIENEMNTLPIEELQCPTCHQWIDPHHNLDNLQGSIRLSHKHS